MDYDCIDPGPPTDAGPSPRRPVRNSAYHCEGVDEFCVQTVNEPCVYGEIPIQTKCQPRDTPGCHCYVGLHPDLPLDVPGRIVSDPCPSSSEDGGMSPDGD